MGIVFAALTLLSVLFGAVNGTMSAVAEAAFTGAGEAVNLVIFLLGTICLWNGVMHVFTASGITKGITHLLMPLLRLLFPHSSKAHSEAAASFTANFFGLGNAALPLGIRTVKAMQKNGQITASDDCILFAVLNTTPLQLIPSTLLALRAAHGSTAPYAVLLPIWIASVITTVFAVFLCKTLAKAFPYHDQPE